MRCALSERPRAGYPGEAASDPCGGRARERTRGEIVAIAKGFIAEQGYAETSTRDIADACGMLPGSLYSHFRSKAQILDLIIGPFYEQLLAEQQAVLAEGGTGVEQLESMIRRVLGLCAAHGAEIRILHYDWPHFARNEELAGLLAQSTETLDLWQRVITTGSTTARCAPPSTPKPRCASSPARSTACSTVSATGHVRTSPASPGSARSPTTSSPPCSAASAADTGIGVAVADEDAPIMR